MLKRRLERAGLIALSFLFIAAIPLSQTKDSHYAAAPHLAAGIATHAFDSNGLCSCLPELSDAAMLDAPRIELNKQAAGFVKQYLDDNDYHLDKLRDKAARYFTVIDTVFTKYALPVELKYMAIIESKMNPVAQSKAGAAGLWQFMPSSARHFGLRVAGNVDERKNAYKSTVAAAKLLVYLHDMFDDWVLAVAAYNSGPAPVLSAIKKSGSRNFWVLQNYLPLETRKHVKKFISIHYFYEGHGSLATMTKAETQAHIKAVESFIKKHEQQPKIDSTTIIAETITTL